MPAVKRRRLGQHVLQPAWAARVAALVAPGPGETFIEIGAGDGALTDHLVRFGATIVAVEVDPRLCQRLHARYRDVPTVKVLCADILTLDRAALVPPGAHVRIAGNLPYYISSPILFRLVDLRDALVDATVMLQREVAERAAAAPGGKTYGVLSVMLQLHADVEVALQLPPGAFRPPPKVESAVVRLRFLGQPRYPVADLWVFGRLVRTAFRERRKTIRNNLKSLFAGQAAALDRALETAGIDPRRRAETLTVSEFSALANFLVGNRGTAML